MWNYPLSLVLILLQDPASTPTPVPTPESGGGFGSFLWLMLGILIGIVIGLLISKAFGKSSGKVEAAQAATLGISVPPSRVVRSSTPQAKRCPVCHSTYTDEALIYCVSDGATLVQVKGSPAHDPDATLLNRDLPPTEAYRPQKPH